jgi:glycosyltransferase involved in cell wall biosynthesis
LILFVGRLVEKKGCEYVLRAMAIVQQEDPKTHLEIIGDGSLRSELEALAKTLAVRAHFRGVQDRFSPDTSAALHENLPKFISTPALSCQHRGQTAGVGRLRPQLDAFPAIPQQVICSKRNSATAFQSLPRRLDQSKFQIPQATLPQMATSPYN